MSQIVSAVVVRGVPRWSTLLMGSALQTLLAAALIAGLTKTPFTDAKQALHKALAREKGARNKANANRTSHERNI